MLDTKQFMNRTNALSTFIFITCLYISKLSPFLGHKRHVAKPLSQMFLPPAKPVKRLYTAFHDLAIRERLYSPQRNSKSKKKNHPVM